MGSKDQKPANLGHGFIAIDPKKFAPGFEKRLSDLIGYVRNLEPVMFSLKSKTKVFREEIDVLSIRETYREAS